VLGEDLAAQVGDDEGIAVGDDQHVVESLDLVAQRRGTRPRRLDLGSSTAAGPSALPRLRSS
jgi:hypothetical protein